MATRRIRRKRSTKRSTKRSKRNTRGGKSKANYVSVLTNYNEPFYMSIYDKYVATYGREPTSAEYLKQKIPIASIDEKIREYVKLQRHEFARKCVNEYNMYPDIPAPNTTPDIPNQTQTPVNQTNA